jgi:hypothetical protein
MTGATFANARPIEWPSQTARYGNWILAYKTFVLSATGLKRTSARQSAMSDLCKSGHSQCRRRFC